MFSLKKAAAAALIAAAGTAASAQDYFFLQDRVDEESVVTIEGVTSSMDGMLVAFDYTGGEVGEMLGSAEIAMGANSDVTIDLGVPTATGNAQSVIVYLIHGDSMDPAMAVASTVYEVDDM